MKKIEINATAATADKKYMKTLNDSITVMHTITGSLPFCSYDNAHSLTVEDVQKHVFVFNIAKGTAKSISFALGDNVDLIDSANYSMATSAYAWKVIIDCVNNAFEKIEKAWKTIEEDAKENVEPSEYLDMLSRHSTVVLRKNDFDALVKDIENHDTNDGFIKLMVFHAMNNGKERRAILESFDKHNQLERLYNIQFVDKEAVACATVKESVNNLFADILHENHEAVGVHSFRVKIDTETKEAIVKACLHSFYEAGAASKKGYHAEVLVENTNKEAICAQVVYALRRAIQRRIVIENAVNG